MSDMEKLKNMKFKTQNDKRIMCSGTSLRGYIDISYAELIEKLGKPDVGDEYKTDAHWDIEWEDGVVATIYNWKDGQNYNGPAGKPVEAIRDWHIGGKDAKAVTHVLSLWPDHRVESSDGNPMSLTKTMFGVGKVLAIVAILFSTVVLAYGVRNYTASVDAITVEELNENP